MEARLEINQGFSNTYINVKLNNKGKEKQTKIRVFNGISAPNRENEYAFFMKIPEADGEMGLLIFLSSGSKFVGSLKHLKVTVLTK